MKKIFIIILCVVASLLCLSALGLAVFLHSLPDDIEPVDDTALRRPVETIPADENAFTQFSAACDAFYLPEDRDKFKRVLYDGDWDQDFVASLLAGNAQCFAHVKRGNALEQCLAPRVTSYDAPMPYLGTWRSIAQLFVLKAESATRDGQPDEALRAVSDLLRFASLCVNDAGCLMQYLVAMNMRELALGAARDVVRSDMLTHVQLSELDQVLRSNQPSTQGLILAWQAEYEMCADLVDSLTAGEIPFDEDDGTWSKNWLQRLGIKYFFHPNRTKRDLLLFYTELIGQVTNVYAHAKLTDVDDFVMKKNRAIATARGLQKFRVPNPIGTILYAMVLPSSQNVMKKQCNGHVSYSATILIAALQSYKRSSGHYPATLDVLVPDVIPEIPMDPYDGQPMRYDQSKGIVYSIGEDLKDSNGSTELLSHRKPMNERQRQWQTEDFVFEVQARIKQSDGAVIQKAAVPSTAP